MKLIIDLQQKREEKEFNSAQNQRMRRIIDWLGKLPISDRLMVSELLFHIEDDIKKQAEKFMKLHGKDKPT